MAINRIYVGIDAQSNLAISLETPGPGVIFVAVSSGIQGGDVCKFVCSFEDLERVAGGGEMEIHGKAGSCRIHTAGDEVVFEFDIAELQTSSSCTLTMNSFDRLLKLAKNRAYVI